MTALADVIAAMTPEGAGWRVEIPLDWRQGRTTYGGLSSALALQAAKASAPDLPPLRSALIAFIGPLAGTVDITATVLRRGRNAAFVEASITSDAGLGYRATFVFMADLPSTITHDASVPGPHRPPPPAAKLYVGPPNFFTGNFEFFDLKDHTGPAEWLRWGRLRERDGLDPEVELLAIADALPPAAMKLAGGMAPVSSLSWIVNVLAPRPVTTDGWWLMSSTTNRAAAGHSSQRMSLFDAGGVPVVDAMQAVAVFA
ncbi:acyl-CoA thioesterase [Sphingomonas sp. RS2018]